MELYFRSKSSKIVILLFSLEIFETFNLNFICHYNNQMRSTFRKLRNRFWMRWSVHWRTDIRRTWRTSTSWRSSSSSRRWSTALTRHRATRPSPSRPSFEDPARTWSPSILRNVDRPPWFSRSPWNGKEPQPPCSRFLGKRRWDNRRPCVGSSLLRFFNPFRADSRETRIYVRARDVYVVNVLAGLRSFFPSSGSRY